MKAFDTAKIYELTPKDGRKSFYGKAKVIVAGDGPNLYCFCGCEFLISYDSAICVRDTDGNILRLPCAWTERDNWSATTGRHIAAFCGLNKKKFLDLPLLDVHFEVYTNKNGAYIEY